MPTDSEHVAGDRLSKQFIIITVCGISVMLVLTMCRMAMAAMAVPDPVDRLATLVVGAMIGWLGKTGIDKVLGTSDAPMVTESKITNAPSEAVPTTDTPTPEPAPEPAPPTPTDEGETITEEPTND